MNMEKIDAFLSFWNSYPIWARISVAICLATAIFTLLLAPRIAVDGKSKDSRSNKQNDTVWLIIDGITSYGLLFEPQIKLHINVNGTKFVYPTLEGVEWLGVGPTMARQQFPLPRRSANGYEIQMRMDMRVDNEIFDFGSVTRVYVKEVPFRGEYELHSIRGGLRGPGIDAVVHFHISEDPNE